MQAKLIRLDEVHRCNRPFSQSPVPSDKPGAIPNGQINLCGGRAVAWVESEVAGVDQTSRIDSIAKRR